MKLKKIGLSHTEQTVYFALLKRGFVVVNVDILSSNFDFSLKRARDILAILTKKGVLSRISKGQYVVIPSDVLYGRKGFVQDPYIVIDQFMKNSGKDYYIGFQSAAHLHGIAEQLPFRVRAAVLKQRKPFLVGETRIEFVTLRKEKFFGILDMRYGGYSIKISDPEKTLLDCLDRPELCGGISEVVKTISNGLDRVQDEKLLGYLHKMNNYALNQRMGFLLENLKNMGYEIRNDFINELWKLRSNYTYSLDPFSPKKGRISKKWKIVENVKLSW